jgi:branched-chain amino acid transport system substrate-binding protein
VWWAGAETDVKDVGDGAKGYNAVACKHRQPRRQGGQGHPLQLYDKGQGTASNKSEVGDVLYIRGCGGAALVEAIRTGQEHFGKGKA